MNTNTQTTAAYRTAAQGCEDRMEWACAAHYYDKAVEAYPAGKGALRDRDIANLRQSAVACRNADRATKGA